MSSGVIDSKLDHDLEENEFHYFFSLFSPRFSVVNKLMAAALKKRYGHKFKVIQVLTARPGDYHAHENFVVLNSVAQEMEKELKDDVVYMQECEDLNVEFSGSEFIKEITRSLLKKQKKIFVYSFTTSFMDLGKEFILIGPNSNLTTNLDNKINHHQLFRELDLPRNRIKVYNSKEELIENYKSFLPCYITAAYTSGGTEAGLVYSEVCLKKFFSTLREVNIQNSEFLLSEVFEEITWAPNVTAMVTGKDETATLVIADQILSGNRYLGNICPPTFPEHLTSKILEITKKVGNHISNMGYRGLFGLDFLIDKDEKMVVIDLNPRRQGGYLCNILALKTLGIELTDIELALALGEKVERLPDYKDVVFPKIWGMTKIKLGYPGKRIIKELREGEIEKIFVNNGISRSTLYKKKSLLIAGDIGYGVVVGDDREKVLNELKNLSDRTIEECVI